ncbi:hypothetical protein [Desulfospira joergensenii]|uniref:hypothetical protein n=1 Tax=Desulfospira joergensenii TaxID=53329 RepID=UPI0003B63F39|nr:hypothetical protein [Desulfospira joergensenii]
MITRFALVKVMILVLLSSFLFSCSPDPKKANSENFKIAINEAIKKSGNSVSARVFSKEDRELYTAAGLIEIYKELEEEKDIMNIIENKKPKMVEVEKDRLTELGKRYHKKAMIGSHFCYGNGEVIEILNFTEPASIAGYTVSHVKYTYKINNIPDWVHVLKKKYKWMEKDIDSSKTPLHGEATLILTNVGWVHEKLFDEKGNS